MKYIDAEKLKARIRKHLIPTVQDRDYDEWEHGRDAGFIQVISIIDSLLQEQPEMDLEKLGEIARHLIAVKDHEEDMRLDEGEWLLLERIGYPERFNTKKEE